MRIEGEKPVFEKELVDLGSLGLKFTKKMAIHRFNSENGKEQWESVFTGGKGVVIAGFTKQGKLILIKQYRFPVESFVLELPSGLVEKNETPLEATQREFLEETGYVADKGFASLAKFWLCNAKIDMPVEIFLAMDCKKLQEPSLDPVEKVAGLSVVEVEPATLIKEIGKGDIHHDPITSHVLLILLQKEIIKL